MTEPMTGAGASVTQTITAREVLARHECRRATIAVGSWSDIDGFVDRHWQAYLPHADKELAALTVAGLVVVPREPTQEMIDAHDIAHAVATNVFAHPAEVWRAMIDAFVSDARAAQERLG